MDQHHTGLRLVDSSCMGGGGTQEQYHTGLMRLTITLWGDILDQHHAWFTKLYGETLDQHHSGLTIALWGCSKGV